MVNLALLGVTAWLFVIIPKDFIPPEDIGNIFGGTEAAEDTSAAQMMRLQRQVTDVAQANPNVQFVFSGVGGFGGQNSGFLYLRLKDRDQRQAADVVLAEVRGELAAIPGINTFLRMPPLITIGQMGRSAYMVSVLEGDIDTLYEWAPKIEANMRALPTLQDVVSDLRLANPRLWVDIDRDKATSVGVSPDAIAQALFSSYGNRQVSRINTASNEYNVILEVMPEFQKDPTALDRIYIRSNTGTLVPLSSVTTARTGVAPLNVNHSGQLPAVNISFNLRPGAALGDAVNQIEEKVADMGLPGTTKLMFQGTAQAFQESLKNLPVLLIMAVLVIFLILGMLYESFIHPITILSGLPSAALGALVTLLLFKMEFSLYGFVGMLLLIGIVKKNAIMMIDVALTAQREEGYSPMESIVRGCLLRYRPIMMTTMAAILGSLPIAIGIGAGAEARRPLGLSIVGGLVVSQAVTLFLTPVLYLYFEQLQHWVMSFRKTPPRPKPSLPVGQIKEGEVGDNEVISQNSHCSAFRSRRLTRCVIGSTAGCRAASCRWLTSSRRACWWCRSTKWRRRSTR